MEPVNETTIVMQNQRYAGFWIRFCAAIIDAILLGIAGLILGAIFTGGASLTTSTSASANQNGISTILFLVYYIYMESSAKQATVGKMIFGLKVTDMNGNRISMLRATGRTFSKYISAIIILFGYIMIAFTEKKQGLHDFIAHTFVVKK